MIRITDKEIQPFEKDHIQKVRTCAADCTLFLKRNGAFPLHQPCSLAAYGRGVRRTVKGGTGSGDVNVRHFVTVEEGLERAGFTVTTKSWLDEYEQVYLSAKKEFYGQLRAEAEAAGVSPLVYGMGRVMPEPEYHLPMEKGGEEAAIYVLARTSGEGSDRTAQKGDVALTDAEVRDILELNRRYEKFILVLNTGGMVDLTPVMEVQNIFILGQLGSATGDVLADILLGKAFPSGKLAMSWAPLDAYPSTEGFGDASDTVYREGIYVGYRYFYTAGKDVLFPFGFGMGYTDFTVEAAQVEMQGTHVCVTASVTNTGAYPGKEAVQVYVSAPSGQLARPMQELAGIAKTSLLQPGEQQTLSVTFAMEDMAAYQEKTASYILEKGNYLIRLGNSSRNNSVCAVVELPETVTTRKLKNICDGDKPENELVLAAPAQVCGDVPRFSLPTDAFQTKTVHYSEPSAPTGKTPVDWKDVLDGKASAADFAAGLSDESLVALCIGNYRDDMSFESAVGAAAMDVAGAAGQTTSRTTENGFRTSIIMADGPAGVRLCPTYTIKEGVVTPTSQPMGEDMYYLVGQDEKKSEVSASDDQGPTYYQNCTAIPIGTDLAQSFDPQVAETFGNIVAEEMENFGVDLWLAPALNIQRSPLCGRNFEYYSEDPLLSGLMAAAVTKSVQSHPGCGTTIKHFACNNQETNRYVSNSIVGERALREIYLRGFEICIRLAQPRAVMSSYNLVNGEHTCNSRDLLTAVLRDEWGYQGLVMTDWLITTQFLAALKHKYPTGSAAGCVRAGNDLIMPGVPTDAQDILAALDNADHPYPVTRGDLFTCATRVLELILSLARPSDA